MPVLLSYDFLVRPTWVGALLDGRRYPRRLPTLPMEAVSMAANN